MNRLIRLRVYLMVAVCCVGLAPASALSQQSDNIPTPLSPIGFQQVQADDNVQISFTELTNAISYQVEQYNLVRQQWVLVFTRSIDCTNGVCTSEIPTESAGTDGMWRVRGRIPEADSDEGPFNTRNTVWGPWSNAADYRTVEILISDEQKRYASRFVQLADFDVTDADIERVVFDGPEAWLDEQLDADNADLSRFEWMEQNTDINRHYIGFNQAVWNRLFTARSGVKERWVLALSEIFVINVRQTAVGGFRGFGGAAYLDMLEENSLGNYRDLLKAITLNHQMGSYLSLLNSQRANNSGRQPDENYAREILQLFSIGLNRLRINGVPILDSNGNEVPTYTNEDITTLAQALTGWEADFQDVHPNDSRGHYNRDMRMDPSAHQDGELPRLMRRTVNNASGEVALESVLDIIANHPNVGPFMATQIIKRLVTSNPSTSYVARVARVFNNDGNGERGNLRAVLKAVLLDAEALDVDRVRIFPGYQGKLREPMIRFIQWGRTFGLNDPNGDWFLPDLSDAGRELGQSPLYSPSVFNFFRPGYVPPNTSLGDIGLTAPELQITSEVSVVGYANYMYLRIINGFKSIQPDYSDIQVLATNPQALVDRLNLILAAGQLSEDVVVGIVDALETMPANTDSRLLRRVYAAIFMVMVSPDYLVLR